MTKVEFFDVIINGGEITDEVIEKAKAMKEQAEKRSSKPTKAQIENEGIKDAILAYLATAEGAVTAAKVAEDTGYVKGKVVALLGQLAKAGKVVAEKGKGKNPMTYTKA